MRNNQWAVIHYRDVSRMNVAFIREAMTPSSQVTAVWDEPTYQGYLINCPEDVEEILPKMKRDIKAMGVDSFIFSTGEKDIVSIGYIAELTPPYGIYNGTEDEKKEGMLPGRLIGATLKELGRRTYVYPEKFIVYGKDQLMIDFAKNCGFDYYPLISNLII